MSIKKQALKQLQYKAWANKTVFEDVATVSVEEQEKSRKTTFRNMLSTLQHVFVVDDIFKAHLTGATHDYVARNTAEWPTLETLSVNQLQMDQWYLDYAIAQSEDSFDELIKFGYVGGGQGVMTVNDILLHLVNHATYHRGFVSDMMYQVPAIPSANDYTVFLRDIWKQQ